MRDDGPTLAQTRPGSVNTHRIGAGTGVGGCRYGAAAPGGGGPRAGGRTDVGEGHDEQVLVEVRGEVAVLTLNRPEKLNAWTAVMMRGLLAAVRAANDDPGIGAIVLTGAGRAFCAGADIGAEFAAGIDKRAAGDDSPSDTPAQSGSGEWIDLVRSSKPMVAAVNGPAVGIGLTMILPFDLIVAARGARLAAMFVKMGLVPELGSSHFLVARCGWGNASWLALTGEMVEATEARELGLVDRVCEPDELLDTAIALAGRMAANSSPAVRHTKQLLSLNAHETDLDLVQQREMERLEACYRTPEHHEAVRAFFEKRPPTFR